MASAIAAGDVSQHDFTIDAAAMAMFATLSGDHSPIHTDAAYAASRGYEGVIVYGGLMLAQLSHMVGMKLPGGDAVSVRWTIDYRSPLYVDEPATFRMEVANVSASTGLIDLRFTITKGERVVATGKAQSMMSPEMLAP